MLNDLSSAMTSYDHNDILEIKNNNKILDFNEEHKLLNTITALWQSCLKTTTDITPKTKFHANIWFFNS